MVDPSIWLGGTRRGETPVGLLELRETQFLGMEMHRYRYPTSSDSPFARQELYGRGQSDM
jgi:hypothetical protein